MIEMKIGERIEIRSELSNETTQILIDGKPMGLVQRLQICFDANLNRPVLECDLFVYDGIENPAASDFCLEMSRCGFVVRLKTIWDFSEAD